MKTIAEFIQTLLWSIRYNNRHAGAYKIKARTASHWIKTDL